ncbi:MAG: hypothetical protein IKN07_03890 [Lachnospiraceae bacterium]|nr:hypothetical protein [Lachnospiraceae bacterium]MBR3734997.1 hypothetical protein [Lachnospiraceae bacterium]
MELWKKKKNRMKPQCDVCVDTLLSKMEQEREIYEEKADSETLASYTYLLEQVKEQIRFLTRGQVLLCLASVCSLLDTVIKRKRVSADEKVFQYMKQGYTGVAAAVMAWQDLHPDGTEGQCIDELGVSQSSVRRFWRGEDES